MPRIGKYFDFDEIVDRDMPDRKFMACCRDRESIDERWVVTSVSEDEARALWKFLSEYFY